MADTRIVNIKTAKPVESEDAEVMRLKEEVLALKEKLSQANAKIASVNRDHLL